MADDISPYSFMDPFLSGDDLDSPLSDFSMETCNVGAQSNASDPESLLPLRRDVSSVDIVDDSMTSIVNDFLMDHSGIMNKLFSRSRKNCKNSWIKTGALNTQ